MKGKRKALMEARLAKVRQRKTVHIVPDLDFDPATVADGIISFYLICVFLRTFVSSLFSALIPLIQLQFAKSCVLSVFRICFSGTWPKLE